jgi:peptide/nickel transport system permease protein
MTKYIVKRLLLMIPTLLGVAVLIFFLMRIVPGDIVELRFAGESAYAQKENLTRSGRGSAWTSPSGGSSFGSRWRWLPVRPVASPR